jgi:hypothetical protein
MQTHVIPFKNVPDLLGEMHVESREVVNQNEVIVGRLGEDKIALVVDLATGDAIQL